jgi:hypothetical protein
LVEKSKKKWQTKVTGGENTGKMHLPTATEARAISEL